VKKGAGDFFYGLGGSGLPLYFITGEICALYLVYLTIFSTNQITNNTIN
jgi:hypothetical protein